MSSNLVESVVKLIKIHLGAFSQYQPMVLITYRLHTVQITSAKIWANLMANDTSHLASD